MSGTKSGAIKAAATNKAKYGEDYYAKMGAKGGSGHRPEKRYFHTHPDVARMVGAKGGRISRRGPTKKQAEAERKEQNEGDD